jgi:hypothetical protein
MSYSIATYWKDGPLRAVFGLGAFSDVSSAEATASCIACLETRAGRTVVSLSDGAFIPVEHGRRKVSPPPRSRRKECHRGLVKQDALQPLQEATVSTTSSSIPKAHQVAMPSVVVLVIESNKVLPREQPVVLS